jgi:hypothetical protein
LIKNNNDSYCDFGDFCDFGTATHPNPLPKSQSRRSRTFFNSEMMDEHKATLLSPEGPQKRLAWLASSDETDPDRMDKT